MDSAKSKPLVKKDPKMRNVDWILLTTNIIAIVVVVIASIQAGSAGLVANLGSYITSSNLF